MRRWGIVVVLAGALALAGACNGDDGGDGGGEAAPAEPAACRLPSLKSPPPVGLAATPPPAPATQQPGKLVAGFFFGDSQLAFGQGGVSMGFEVDMMREVAGRLGLELVMEGNNDREDLVPNLRAGRYDVAVSSLTADPAHADDFDYTRPYLTARQALSVRTDDADEVSLDKLPTDGVVGVRRGSLGERFAVAHCTGVAVRSFEDTRETLRALVDGRVDAVVHDFPPIRFVYEPGWPEQLQMSSVFPIGDDYVMAVPEGHPDLVAALDHAIAGLEADGTLRRLEERWVLEQVPEGARAF